MFVEFGQSEESQTIYMTKRHITNQELNLEWNEGGFSIGITLYFPEDDLIGRNRLQAYHFKSIKDFVFDRHVFLIST